MLSEREIKELFAVIPGPESRRAQIEFQDRLHRHSLQRDSRIFWLDFDHNLAPQGAGFADLGELAAQRFNPGLPVAQLPNEISELMESAASGSTRAGDISPSRLGDRFLWFVPISPLLVANRTQTTIRALSVSYDLLSQLIETFNPGAGLTRSESRVVSQLVSGLSLQDCADRDGLQIETRRGQLKRACAKLSVSGQTALIRLILSQAIQLLFIVDEEMRRSTSAADFAAAHLPGNVHLQVRQFPDGRHLRIFEFGDPDGEPIIVVHGFFFVLLLQGLANGAATQGLRFLMPLRYGYLVQAGESPVPPEAFDPQSANDADLRSLLDLVGPAKILGHSMGCVAAVRFAKEHPQLVTELLLASPYLGKSLKGRAQYLSRIMGVLSRIRSNGLMFRLVAAQFARSYSKPENVETALNRIFGDCASDVLVQDGECGFAPVASWFGQVFAKSIEGIAEDFRALLKFTNAEISDLKVPCRAFVGDEDPLFAGLGVQHCAVTGRDIVQTVRRSGHFAVVTAADDVFAFLTDKEASG